MTIWPYATLRDQPKHVESGRNTLRLGESSGNSQPSRHLCIVICIVVTAFWRGVDAQALCKYTDICLLTVQVTCALRSTGAESQAG